MKTPWSIWAHTSKEFKINECQVPLRNTSTSMCVTQRREVSKCNVFYCRRIYRDYLQIDSFKLIRIPLEQQPDVKRFLRSILESCNLSTEKIEKLKIRKVSTSSSPFSNRNAYSQSDASRYEEYEVYARTTQKAKQDKTLKLVPIIKFTTRKGWNWIYQNIHVYALKFDWQIIFFSQKMGRNKHRDSESTVRSTADNSNWCKKFRKTTSEQTEIGCYWVWLRLEYRAHPWLPEEFGAPHSNARWRNETLTRWVTYHGSPNNSRSDDIWRS